MGAPQGIGGTGGRSWVATSFDVVDTAFRDWVIAHRNGTLTEFMVNASRFGSSPSLVVIALVAAGLLVWRGRRGDAVLVVATCAGVLILGPILKVLFTRPRPP